MKHIKLGDLDVSRIGLGAMSMSAAYTGAGSDDAEAIRTIHRASDLGVSLIDTAEVDGPFTPIPGTKRVARVEENTAAHGVELTAAQIEKLTKVTPAAGDHHAAAQMRMIEH